MDKIDGFLLFDIVTLASIERYLARSRLWLRDR